MSTLKVDTIEDKGGAFEHARLVQVVNLTTGALGTGTTTMPHDDTIPQNDEGDQYMTLAITPTHASNKLLIEVVGCFGNSAADWHQTALFKDSDAGAISATTAFFTTATAVVPMVLTHFMVAGSTSEITFKVRSGLDSSGTTSFNGQNAGRMLGGVHASSMTISEIRV